MRNDRISAPIPRKAAARTINESTQAVPIEVDPLERSATTVDHHERSTSALDTDDNIGNKGLNSSKSSTDFSKQYRSFTPNNIHANSLKSRILGGRHQQSARRHSYCTLESTREHCYNLDYPENLETLAHDQLDPSSRFYARNRPRTLNLPKLLPYETESPQDQAKFLSHIVSHLYIAIKTLDLQGSLSVTAKDLASVKANLSDVDLALETNLFEMSQSQLQKLSQKLAHHLQQQLLQDDEANYFSMEELNDSDDDEEDDDEDDDEGEEDPGADDYDDDADGGGAGSAVLAIQHKKSPKSAAVVGVKIWTHELLVWLKMKYDMPINLRILLARVYYAICLSRGQHINLKTYVKTFEILTKNNIFMKQQGLKLDWEPLSMEILNHFPAIDSSNNDLHYEKKDQKQLLRLAEKASFFFDKSSLPKLYTVFGSKFSIPNAYLVFQSFSMLPATFTSGGVKDPEDIRHYIESIYYMWQKLSKSSNIDVHLTSRLGTIAMAALSDKANNIHSSHVNLSEYGVFTSSQMNYIFNTLMNSLSIMNEKYSSLKSNFFHGYSSSIVFSINGNSALTPEIGILNKLLILINATELYVYPSNSGEWSRPISKLILSLVYQFHKRYNMESQVYGQLFGLPDELKISKNDEIINKFVNTLIPVIKIGIQAKYPKVSDDYQKSLHMLAFIRPQLVLEALLLDIYESLEGVISTHRVNVALRTLEELSRYFASTKVFRVHLARILLVILPGIDSNDLEKCLFTLNVFASFATFVPFYDLTNGEGDETLALQFTLEHLEFLQAKLITPDLVSGDFECSDELELMALKSSTSSFKIIFKRLFERIFVLLENLPDPSKSSGMEKHVSEGLPKYVYDLLESVSDDILHVISNEMFNFISEKTFHIIADVVAEICGGIVKRNPKKYFKKFARHLIDRITEDIVENGAGVSRTGVEFVSRDQPLFWNLVILNECIGNANECVLLMADELQNFSFFLMDNIKGPAVFASSYMLNQILQSTTKIRLNENRLISPAYEAKYGIDEKCWGGFQFDEEVKFKEENLKFSWFIPTQSELRFAIEFFNVHVSKILKNIRFIMKKFSSEKETHDSSELIKLSDDLRMNFLYLGYSVSGISFLFDPSFDEDIPKLQHQSQSIQQRLVLLNQIRQLKGSKSLGKDELRIENLHENLSKIIEDLNSDGMDFDLDKDEEVRGGQKRSDEDDEKDDEDVRMRDVDDMKHGEVPSSAGVFAAHLTHVPSSDSISSMDASASRLSPGIEGVDVSTMNPGITFRDQKLYTSNYLFGDNIESRRSNELYIKVHKIRALIGKSLHMINKFLITHFHDNTKLFKHFLYVVNIWFSDVGRERLLDYSHAKISYGYTSTLQHINKVKKPFTRTAIGARLETYHLFRVVLHATSRTQTDLDKVILEDVVKLCFSTYSAISKSAQATLVDAMKRLNGSYNVLMRSSLKYLSKAIEDNDIPRIESGLHTFSLKRIKYKIQNDYFNIQKYVELLQKCLLVDEAKVNELAHKLFKGVYNNITPPSSTCIIHNWDEIDCIRPPDEYIDLEINVVKLAKENKRKLYFEKLRKFENMVLTNEKSNSHWKSTSLNLYLLINLQLELEIPINKQVLDLLAVESANEHPLVSRLAIKGSANLIKRMYFLESINYNLSNAYDFEFIPRNYISINTTPKDGVSYLETWKNELQSIKPHYFIDSKASSGWLFWGETMFALDANVENLVIKHPLAMEALNSFGSHVNKAWFLGIVKLWIADNESNFAFQGSDVLFTVNLVYLISTGFIRAMTFKDLISVIEEVYDADEKSSHIVVCELISGVLIASKVVYNDLQYVEERDEFLVKFLGDLFENDLNPDNSGVWSIFSWWLFSLVDFRRFPKIIEKCFTSFKIDPDSDSAFFISTRLSYIKSFVAAVSWSYPIPDETTMMCLANIGHRYQSIREQVGSLLAMLTFVYYSESLPSSKFFLENCIENEGAIMFERNKSNKLHELIPTIFSQIEEERLKVVDLTPQEILKSAYIYSVSTILTWLEQALITSVATVYQDYVDIHIIPFLLKLTNMKDVCQLGNLDPITCFKRISQIPFNNEMIEKIILMIEKYSSNSSSEFTLNVVQSFIMGEFTETFYFKNLYKFTKQQRLRIIELTNNLIYHKNVELREAAASTLSGLIHISPPEEIESLVKTLVKKYSGDLESTRKKYKKKAGGFNFKKISTTDSIILHGATLGLGSLIHAFPFLSPPPKWVPELLTLLANKSSGLPGIVGKTAKESLGKFKKNRQDTWHVDSKVFNEEQIQDLEGVLWKSYFI